MTINFYNNFNNGDIHFSRGLINLVKKTYPNYQYNFLHKNKKGILKDMSFINELDLNEKCAQNKGVSFYDGEIYINTWYGQNDFIFLRQNGGCTLKTVMAISSYIFSQLNKTINFEEETLYPTVDFKNFTVPNTTKNFKILICNSESLSEQSNNVNLDHMIDVLSDLYPEITFYVTKKTEITKQNIIYTSDITNITPDLLEISYISTKCEIIVGRGSGPYSFSILLENIKDDRKTFVGLCNKYIEGIWDTRFLKCKYVHNSSGDIDNITKNLIEIIKGYGY
jgi:hypothetical protein